MRNSSSLISMYVLLTAAPLAAQNAPPSAATAVRAGFTEVSGWVTKAAELVWSDAIEKGATDKATLATKLKQASDRCTAAYTAGTGDIGQLMANVAHTNLHYGNLITYIRMLGMTPPSS